MQTKFNWADGVATIVGLLPLAYLAAVYPSLSPTLPVHFDLEGNPNRYGSRPEFAWGLVLVCGVGLGSALLVRFLPRIDPKKQVRFSEGLLTRISYGLVFFLSAIGISIVYAGVHGHFAFHEKLLYPLLGLFFAYLGNLFNNIKPNYFVGIRTPWTLENDEVWRKTHRLAARLWLPGGVLLSVLCWILPEAEAHAAFVAGLVVLLLVPVGFSYIYYRQVNP